MKAIILTLSFLLFWLSGKGQFVEFFEDNDLNSNPTWTGNIENFTVLNGELKLSAPAEAATSMMSTSSSAINEGQWRVTVRMEFNPSSNNYSQIHLVSSAPDLNGYGYFVKLGGTQDEVSLYRQDINGEQKIIDGLDGRLSSNLVVVEILAQRDVSGNWLLESRLENESSFSTEGSTVDLTYEISKYFGLKCTYTATRSTKFAFDNIEVTGQGYVDTKAPEIRSARITGENNIDVQFTESIDTVFAKINSNYMLNGTSIPESIAVSDSSLLLTFSSFNLDNNLDINVLDLAGNLLDTTAQLVYADPIPAEYGDIIINEIMFDPSPPEDLPEFEYVELLNTTDRVINLKDWTFSDRSKEVQLDEFYLYPNAPIILTSVSGWESFSSSNAIGLDPWPSLNNTGDELSLVSPTGSLINRVDYTTSISRAEQSIDGGISLELIYPEHQCSTFLNWNYSIDPSGGTPGGMNSNYESQDNYTPEITHSNFSDSSLILSFNELVVPDLLQVEIDPSTTGWTYEHVGEEVAISFDNTLSPSQPYSIIVSGIRDCNGNFIENIEIDVLIPSTAIPGDVIFNEILFNPYPEGVDFIEIKNLSNKYFDLSKWSIDNGETSRPASDSTWILDPYDFAVLTRNSSALASDYWGEETNYLNVSIPAMNNDKGSLGLRDKNILIDTLVYDESQHLKVLLDVEGVSLERISSDLSSLDRNNWVSASSTVGFATPGYENSQNNAFEAIETELQIIPDIIVPNNQGNDEFFSIEYNLDESGYLATVEVFNLHGQLISTVANNATIGYQGRFIWQGLSDRGEVVPTGHYLINVQFLHTNGLNKRYQRKVVVSKGF